MKVLVRAPFSEKGLEGLRTMYDEVVYDPWNKTGEWFEDEKTSELLQKEKPDIFITELDRVRERTLSSCGGLKLLGVCRANPANVDVNGCTEQGIPIICTPARNAQAVAECAVGMTICYMRHIAESADWEKNGNWGKGEGPGPYSLFKGNELHGKKIGFVGFGAVGRAAAVLFQAFGTEIVFYDPFVDRAEGAEKVSLEELFSTCDIVSIHLPVNDSTRKMIGAEQIALMKPTAVFLNTARSAVVDMDALYVAVRDKKIGGAVMDVMDQEPPEEEEIEKWRLNNVLLTPHICGASYEVSDHHSDIMVERLKKWEKQEDIDRIVFNRLK